MNATGSVLLQPIPLQNSESKVRLDHRSGQIQVKNPMKQDRYAAKQKISLELGHSNIPGNSQHFQLGRPVMS